MTPPMEYICTCRWVMTRFVWKTGGVKVMASAVTLVFSSMPEPEEDLKVSIAS